jgi:DNA-directed RNA polymerase subunit RPC12/RpoP
MSSYFDGFSGDVEYECLRCGTHMTGKDLDNRGGYVKCINCGYRVLKKLKPPIVKRARAR